MKHINAANASVFSSLLQSAVLMAELSWHMHQAQLISLENMSLNIGFEIKNEVETETKEVAPMVGKRTLLGLPIYLDSLLPKSWIELRRGAEVLVRIESLAIPAIFSQPISDVR